MIEVGAAAEAPVPLIKTTPEKPEDATVLEGQVPFEVVFDGTGSTDPNDDIVDYNWDFDGDGEVDEVGGQIPYTYI